MRARGPNFFPLALPFLLGLFALAALLLALVEIGVLEYAYEKVGIAHRYVFALLALSLAGSYLNVPVAALPEEHVLGEREVSFFGVRYVVPVVEERARTIVAVNVGGAVVPAALSLFLLARSAPLGRGLLAVAIVTAVVHRLARPVPGVGIAVPALVPPIVAAVTALALAPAAAPAVAYVAGSLGTLVGADLLNLHRLRGLGAPVASIGGAGTFDGIFLTGILAVLLA